MFVAMVYALAYKNIMLDKVRFQVLKPASMKMARFWNTVKCSLVLRTASIISATHRPDEGGSMHL
jgi:hypothetical protein